MTADQPEKDDCCEHIDLCPQSSDVSCREQARRGRRAAIVGDWTGEIAGRQEREAAAYRDLRARLRTMTCDFLKQREHWANSSADGAVARAVAYQNVTGRLIRLLDAIEREHDVRYSPGERSGHEAETL